MTSIPDERAKAVVTMLACIVDKQADFNSTLCVLKADGGRGIVHTFGRQALPMLWDFAEANPFNLDIASWASSEAEVFNNIELLSQGLAGSPTRGSAMSQPWADASLDAVITDPPYYDNVPYSNISDFFYVWLKRSVGNLYPEHFGGAGTPKKQEAVADATRHGGDKAKANRAYEQMMADSLAEANRVLKPGGSLAVVYAHKTTLGWATLVDAFRRAGFTVSEAWPLDTETTGRLRAQASAALASSIFLVGRKRESKATGSYESDVQPELETIVRERVETLWDQGISGADLVIACVGAGLRAFTRFARVEYANGDEVPAERFLTEVETVVLDSILARLSKEAGGKGTSLVGVDPATRFYTLWRYTYHSTELDSGEAIIFANGTHVELDGPSGMSSGADALVEKKKGKYRLRDYTERGNNENLGQPTDEGQAAPLVDVLHRVLWLMEHRPRELATFLRETEPNRELLRLVAQALAGPALKGSELANVSPSVEMAALAKLTANWRSVIEDNATTVEERADRKSGQQRLFE
jgi:putative DNA methylase